MSYTYYKVNDEVYRVTAEYDELAEDPREWYEHMTHMNMYVNRYKLGDNDGGERETDLIEFARTNIDNAKLDEMTFDELWSLCQNHPDFVALPIYAYIHSGITISTGSFGDPWDSGWAGYIYVTREDYTKNGMEWAKKDAIKLLESEVKEYDNYLTGQVYVAESEKLVEVTDDCEEWDTYESCGGIYSDEYGEDLCREAAEAIGFSAKVEITEDELNTIIKEKREAYINERDTEENNRLALLERFGDVARKVYDKYHINSEDLQALALAEGR